MAAELTDDRADLLLLGLTTSGGGVLLGTGHNLAVSVVSSSWLLLLLQYLCTALNSSTALNYVLPSVLRPLCLSLMHAGWRPSQSKEL